MVSHNAAAVLGDCLRSLRDEVRGIVVVDNASSDGSEAVATSLGPPVTWVPAGANLGYGRAANLGVARTAGAAVLVCNPDLVLHPGAVAALWGALEADPAVGIVGPRLRNLDGSIYPSARAFPSLVDAVGHGAFGAIWPTNPFSRRYKLLDWDHGEARRIDWVSGACMLVRREAWDALAGFDAGYFMYMEDVDLCWRAWRAGWAVAYEPAAEVTHAQGVSTGAVPYRMIAAHHWSLWRFARRTTVGWRRALLPVVGAGLAVRCGVACLQHRAPRQRSRIRRGRHRSGVG